MVRSPISRFPNKVVVQETIYLFVDGANFRQYFNETMKRWVGHEVEFEFAKIKEFFGAEKAFYYDCVDDVRGVDETSIDFDARVNEQEEKLNNIREIEGCHVYLGSLAGSGKKKRQKEVDVLLAIQMMEHAFRGNMQKAVLLSGDKDFRPLVESLVRLGLSIEVVGDKHHISQDLIHSADSHKKLSFENYLDWLPIDLLKKYKLDGELTSRTGDILTHFSNHHIFTLHSKGKVADSDIYIYLNSSLGNYHLVSPQLFRNNVRNFTDLERMKLYLELQYGAISWE